MIFRIDRKVFETFPTLVVAIPIILGFDNTRSKEESLKLLRSNEVALRDKLTLESFWQDRRVTSYLECFKKFGVDPEKFIPAHVALTRRVLEGKPLPDINPLVNLYNAFSIKYLTPFGGENLDALYGDFSLKIAQGGEQWIPIGGGKSKPALKKELIWLDDFDVSTRCLNWRQCDRTKMTETTTNGYFIIDGFEDVNRENIATAAGKFVQVATKMFGGKGKIYWLDKSHSEADIPFKSKTNSQKVSGQSKQEEKKGTQKPSTQTKTETSKIAQLLSHNQPLIIKQLQTIIAKGLEEEFSYKVGSLDEVKIEHPKVEDYGDYASNIALILRGKLKMKPFDVAEKLARKLQEYIGEHQTTSIRADSKTASTTIYNVGEILEHAKAVQPGFLNLVLASKYLSTRLATLLDPLRPDGTVKNGNPLDQVSGEQLKVVVEYTDPNPFKEFHLGHLYSNVIGESIARLFEGVGAKVWRADYYGDVGMHVAKSVWGMMKKIKEDKITLETLEKLSIKERQRFLGQGYALGVRTFEEDEKVQEEIKEINYLVYVAAQQVLQKTKGWKPIINYKQYIEGNEDKLDEILKVYDAGLRWSLQYFEAIYQKLGTKFDGYYPESWVGEYGMQLVQKGIKLGVFEKDNGAVVFRGEKYGLHTRVFVNKLGLPTYEAKELGLAPAKYEQFKYDLSVIVTGHEIKEYFQVLLTVLRLIDPELGNKTINLSHGMVKLPEGKMSSRTGTVITYEWLLDKAKKQAFHIMKDIKLSEDEKQIVAEKVGLAAIRYALLKGSPGNDVVFDFEKSVSFEGESGPYLQYTYARCKSVLRKAQTSGQLPVLRRGSGQAFSVQLEKQKLNSEELALLRTFVRIDEVVYEAARGFSPNLICSYLFNLAQKFNLFYAKHSILGIRSEEVGSRQETRNKKQETVNNKSVPTTNDQKQTTMFRLSLTQATANVLSYGLYLLGIETVEKM